MQIDYYFTPVSPWTYLGHGRFAALLRKFGASVRVLPVAYGRIFPLSGGVPLAQRPEQRKAYRLVELARWRDFLQVPLNQQPRHFPVPDGLAARTIVALRERAGDGAAMQLAGAIMRAVWVEERNVADAPTLQQIAGESGFDGPALLAAAESAEVQQAYERDTDTAIGRQVFGAPTYVLNGELFWGQDRLDFLERAMQRAG